MATSSNDDPGSGIPPHLPKRVTNPFRLPSAAHLRLLLFPLLILSIVLGVVALGLVAAKGLFSTPGSTKNDEVITIKKQTGDYATWSAALRDIERTGELPAAPQPEKISSDEDEGRKVSTWDKWFVLPNETAVRAALQRRLPKDVKLVSLVPLTYEKADDEISVNYLVTVRPRTGLSLVPVTAIKFSQPDLSKYQGLAQYILASNDLAPGLTYEDAAAKPVIEPRKNIIFSWRVNRAAVEDGKWRVYDADPIFLEQMPALETKLVNMSGGRAMVLRSQSEIDAMPAVRDEALTGFVNRIRQIQEQVKNYRSEKMADVPGKASRSTGKFGGSGSGEPTRSAARIGGGAAGGAAIGAMATGGSGEAAGIGAGAGLVAGLVYDMVSKSNDKKKFEAAKERDYQERVAARNSAVRAAERNVTNFEQQLLGEYQKELVTAAEQRMTELRARDGVTTSRQ